MANYTVTDGQNDTINAVYASQNQFDYGNITVAASGTATMTFYGGGQAYTSINLAPGAHLTGTITGTSLGTMTINGDASTLFIAAGISDFSSTDSTFNAPIGGTGTIESSHHFLSVNGPVGSGVTFAIKNGEVLDINNPGAFTGTAEVDDAHLVLANLDRPTDYSYIAGVATIYGGGDDHQLASFHLTDTASDGPLSFYSNPNGPSGIIKVQDEGADTGDVALAQHVVPPPQPSNVAVHDTTTGANVPDTSSAYTGPVAGIVSQFIDITPDNLNVTAKADGLFIKTGTGNDAVALRGGTNVVDAGTGSNFLTSGSGFDTFFLDARNIPAASSAAGPVPGAIWDTIQGFAHGDAVTIFGIGPGTALAWQPNEGAVGHTGVTLHANLPNGSETSLTLAGLNSRAGLSLSYGSTGGASYLYVKV